MVKQTTAQRKSAWWTNLMKYIVNPIRACCLQTHTALTSGEMDQLEDMQCESVLSELHQWKKQLAAETHCNIAQPDQMHCASTPCAASRKANDCTGKAQDIPTGWNTWSIWFACAASRKTNGCTDSEQDGMSEWHTLCICYLCAAYRRAKISSLWQCLMYVGCMCIFWFDGVCVCVYMCFSPTTLLQCESSQAGKWVIIKQSIWQLFQHKNGTSECIDCYILL